MIIKRLRYVGVAVGRPYHAALVPISESARRVLPHSHADFRELVYVVRGWGWQQVAGDDVERLTGQSDLLKPIFS